MEKTTSYIVQPINNNNSMNEAEVVEGERKEMGRGLVTLKKILYLLLLI